MTVSLRSMAIASRIERGDYRVDPHEVARAIMLRRDLAPPLFGSMLVARELHGVPGAVSKLEPGAGGNRA